ncbi:MFS transporter [Salinarimonas soli]|uniref:MFS transporter n=1 Tax=Salinarimonas soli TaxID=1638099 RepID=A0A5B2VG31_9HYPH|nr:MFS transporter [Salinarimonas soli]KAA2237279.1 MFS transporter [Salinarimonas soli]
MPRQRILSNPAFRLAALHGAAFAAIGVSMPFLPVWMESRGLGAGAIGVLLAIPTVVRVLVTAPLMSLADSPTGARRLLVLGQVGAALGYIVMLGAESPLVIALLVAAVAVAQAPIVPTGDLLTTDAVRADPSLNYGRIRVWGSITFLATSIAGGYVLALLPPDGILWTIIGLGLLAMLVSHRAALVRDTPALEGRRRVLGLRFDLPRPLALAIAACACVQASHAAVYGFGSIHWRSLGFSGPVIGVLWSIGVVAEIALFIGLGRMVSGGVKGLRLVGLGAGAAAFRFGVLATDPGLAATACLQALHALTFGATHLGAMAALTALSPPGARGAAQGVYSAGQALATGLAMVASGGLYRWGGPLAFAAMAPLALLGLGLVLLAMRAASQPQRVAEGG